MWVAACTTCGWTSGERMTREAAEILRMLHEEDNLGHRVGMTAVPTASDASPDHAAPTGRPAGKLW